MAHPIAIKLARMRRRMILNSALDESFPAALVPAFRYLASYDLPPAADAVHRRIEALRAEIAARDGGLDCYFGGFKTYRDIAETSSVEPRYGAFLHLCAAAAKAEVILEVGSAIGIGSCYVASSPACRRFIGFEGGRDTTLIHENLATIVPSVSVQIVEGDIERTLAETLGGLNEPVDFAWLDGDHHCEPTIRALDQVVPHLKPGAIVVFDDIRYTVEMEAVWERVKRWPGFSHVIDAFRVGVAVWDGTTAVPKYWPLARVAAWPYRTDVLNFPNGDPEGPYVSRRPAAETAGAG